METTKARTTGSDRIEKQILLRAPIKRVWRALSDATEFGSWFGATFTAPFVAGAHIRGMISPTTADATVAEAQKPYAGKPFEVTIDRIEPDRLFSFRWHPFAVDPAVDYSAEPTTLVVFELRETPEGTLLTIVESGFDRIPLARRAKAFSMNEGGWQMQLTLIEKHVARAL
jgi:uncharacterized protein YndB with AHSA1/START domain